MLRSLFRFFSSLKLAVVSILSLAFVLAYATVAESFYGMRGAHLLVYGQWWFSGLLFLIGLNVLCAALSRYPWKARQTGFVITHLGIITILMGSFLTQQFGVDGNLAVMESTQANLVTMSDLVLTLRDEENKIQAQVPVPEYAKRKAGDLLTVKLGHERLVVKEFLPRVVPEKKIVASPLGGLGSPALKLEIFNSRFHLEEWLRTDHPTTPKELNLGPATLSLRKLWTAEEERAVLSGKGQSQTLVGPYIVLSYEGKDYRVGVADSNKRWSRVGQSGLELMTERYLPYAIVSNGDLISKSKEPVNPAVQILVRRVGETAPAMTEKYTIFSLYPEFNTMHRKQATKMSLGLQFQLVMPSQQPRGRGRLDLYVLKDGSLYFRSLGAAGDLKNQGKLAPEKETPTGWMDLKFKVAAYLPESMEETLPRYVEEISGGNASFLSGIRFVRLDDRTPAQEALNSRWVLEGGSESVAVGRENWTVQYSRRSLELPFSVFLEKFTIGNDPGTTKAATYESDVRIAKTGLGVTKELTKISMNEPLHYGGYTFYQASYQMEEGRKPVSVFSVNFDPGRSVKYLGSIVMVLGIILMFSLNPQYWEKLLGRTKPK